MNRQSSEICLAQQDAKQQSEKIAAGASFNDCYLLVIGKTFEDCGDWMIDRKIVSPYPNLRSSPIGIKCINVELQTLFGNNW